MAIKIKSLSLAHCLKNRNESSYDMDYDCDDPEEISNLTLCELMEQNMRIIKDCEMDQEIESVYGNRAIAGNNPYNFKNAISTYDPHIRVQGIRYSDELSEEDSSFLRKISDFMELPIGGPMKPIADNLYKLIDKTFDDELNKGTMQPETLPDRLGRKKRLMNEMNAEHQKLLQLDRIIKP